MRFQDYPDSQVNFLLTELIIVHIIISDICQQNNRQIFYNWLLINTQAILWYINQHSNVIWCLVCKSVLWGKIMERKKDRRVAMTKRMLKEALTGVLRETDIYHVSIRELCDKADVNRTTFYKYYGSQFDLLSDMENDLLSFLSKTITEHSTNAEKIIETACEYLENHIEFARLIINNNVDPLFPQKLFSLDSMREATLKEYFEKHDESTIDYLFNYITYGAYRIICIWLNKERRESPDQIARLLAGFINQH